VYAHPVNDAVRLAERVEAIARVHPEGSHLLVKVIAPDSDYWPLPWYLRRLGRVGYWSGLPDQPDAPVIVASTQLQDDLAPRRHDAYHVSS
jgi:predicted membrane-bound mannosyltransferase